LESLEVAGVEDEFAHARCVALHASQRRTFGGIGAEAEKPSGKGFSGLGPQDGVAGTFALALDKGGEVTAFPLRAFAEGAHGHPPGFVKDGDDGLVVLVFDGLGHGGQSSFLESELFKILFFLATLDEVSAPVPFCGEVGGNEFRQRVGRSRKGFAPGRGQQPPLTEMLKRCAEDLDFGVLGAQPHDKAAVDLVSVPSHFAHRHGQAAGHTAPEFLREIAGFKARRKRSAASSAPPAMRPG
jgi:hypothetical protein